VSILGVVPRLLIFDPTLEDVIGRVHLSPVSTALVLGEVLSILDSLGVDEVASGTSSQETIGVAFGLGGEGGRPPQRLVGLSGTSVVGTTTRVVGS
jgi:hypothetical protein